MNEPILLIFLFPWAICVWAMYMMIVTTLKHEAMNSAWFFVSLVRARYNREYLLIFTAFVFLEVGFFTWAILMGLTVPLGL
jgi:hypothetical protein